MYIEPKSSAPWERRENETSKAYSAFKIYLNMPPDIRKIADVAPLAGMQEKGVYRYSQIHNWVDRARAYDSYMTSALVEVEAASLETYKDQVVAFETQASAVLQDIFGAWVMRLHERVKSPHEGDQKSINDALDNLSARQFVSMINAFEKLSSVMRRTGGMPTNFNTDKNADPPDEEGIFFIKPDA